MMNKETLYDFKSLYSIRFPPKHFGKNEVSFILSLCTAVCFQNNTHITVASLWAGWHLKSRALRLSTQPFVQIKKTSTLRASRSRCAWLTGPQPCSGYARTSFGIDAAAEVTISKCNLLKSWTLELTSEFSRAHLTILAQCGMLAGFVKTMQAAE